MNKVILMGRLTRDPDVRYTTGENPLVIARYTLAVDRRFHKDGEATADFISCVVFGRAAEFAEKYFGQGLKITISGRIQTGSYTNKEVYQMKQGGLLFPKESARKKRKKHHKSIIDRDVKNQCFICGKTGYTERHHIYGSANRKYSEQYGLTVYLCPECHRTSEISAHRNKEVRITLQRIGQRTFEKKCGSRDKFTGIFGKNYLEDE